MHLYIMMNILLHCYMQTQRVGNDRLRLLLKTIDAKSSSLKSLLSEKITNGLVLDPRPSFRFYVLLGKQLGLVLVVCACVKFSLYIYGRQNI